MLSNTFMFDGPCKKYCKTAEVCFVPQGLPSRIFLPAFLMV